MTSPLAQHPQDAQRRGVAHLLAPGEEGAQVLRAVASTGGHVLQADALQPAQLAGEVIGHGAGDGRPRAEIVAGTATMGHAPKDGTAMHRTTWEVVQVRTGYVESRHRTEAAAWQAFDRSMRRRKDRPRQLGGGYGFVELAVREVGA